MTDNAKNLKAMAQLLPQIENTTDPDKKAKLLEEFYALSAPVAQDVLGDTTYDPTGFTAADQIQKMTFEL